MKVLMTADAVGGVWTYAVDLCRGLAQHGVEVVLATMGPAPSAAQQRCMGALPNVRLNVGPWKLEWMDDPWSEVTAAGEWLLELARRERVELVHVNGFAHAALAFGRPCICVAHSCVCSWWQAVHDESAPPAWDRYRQTVAEGLCAATFVIAPTHAFFATLQSLYGPIFSGTVIHNGYECAESPALRREPLIVACGRAWDVAKNLATLDAAVGELPWQACVAGDATSPDGRTLCLHSLRSLGALAPDELRGWMRRAAIFAHPARYEPFGLAVLEAASHGCALVLSDIPSLRELWDGAALFAPSREPQAFRAQLMRLISRPDERAALAQLAIDRAQKFRAERMCGEYAALYGRLVRSAGHQELAVA